MTTLSNPTRRAACLGLLTSVACASTLVLTLASPAALAQDAWPSR
ncbi:MAG: hypothetical protein JWQ88_1224, partial [Rhodoferax sp.]|nr:hypothetical protein [Rhodoferax sp.]